jgi:hypothetical protein
VLFAKVYVSTLTEPVKRRQAMEELSLVYGKHAEHKKRMVENEKSFFAAKGLVVLAVHKKMFVERSRPYPGAYRAAKLPREARCGSCKREVDNAIHYQCAACRWIVCPACGWCGCWWR